MNAKPTHTIARPVSPRISKLLDGWVEESDDDVLIQGSLVREAVFSGVTKLQIDDCVVENSSIAAHRFERLELTDSRLKHLEGAGVRTNKVEFLRIELNDSRLTGADFPDAKFEDCTFKNVKFDEAGFRFAKFKRVRFEDCILSRADFSHSAFEHVSFAGCDLAGTNFDAATCHDVDMGSENLSECTGILGLKGTTISDEQLIQIAPLLANELGFKFVG